MIKIWSIFLLFILGTNTVTNTAQGETDNPSNEGVTKSHLPKIDRKDYRIHDANGKPVAFDAMCKRLATTQIIFLGETHDDPVAHHLQSKILQAMHKRGTVALSLEMFERDVQHVVDEYLAGLITEQHFLSSSRPWKNYKTDYRPLVEYAKKHKLAVIAANAPRRYVNRVGRLGAAALDAIPNPRGRGLPPLPYAKASREYAAQFQSDHEKDAQTDREETKTATQAQGHQEAATQIRHPQSARGPEPVGCNDGVLHRRASAGLPRPPRGASQRQLSHRSPVGHSRTFVPLSARYAVLSP